MISSGKIWWIRQVDIISFMSTMLHVLVVVYDTKTQYFYFCDCFCCADNIKLSSTPVKSTTVSM